MSVVPIDFQDGVNDLDVGVMHQSIPPAPRPPPRANPWELAFFFLMDGKFALAGALKLSNARR